MCTGLLCLCVSAHSYARCCLNYDDFLSRHRAQMTVLLSQVCKVYLMANTFKKFYGRRTDLVGQYKKTACQMFADSVNFADLPWPN